MAKRENDLSERTLRDKVDGPADKQAGLGKLSKVKRSKRGKPSPQFANAPKQPRGRERAAVQADPRQALAQQFLQTVSSDLHARDAKGRKIPTLADRIRSEGYKAQLGKKKGKRK
jgi:hypothetical protein